jgi:hypothetical protein
MLIDGVISEQRPIQSPTSPSFPAGRAITRGTRQLRKYLFSASS